MIHKILF